MSSTQQSTAAPQQGEPAHHIHHCQPACIAYAHVPTELDIKHHGSLEAAQSNFLAGTPAQEAAWADQAEQDFVSVSNFTLIRSCYILLTDVLFGGPNSAKPSSSSRARTTIERGSLTSVGPRSTKPTTRRCVSSSCA